MRFASALVFFLIAPVTLIAEVEPPREVRAVRSHSPKIDGVLEAEWFGGGVADSFIQSRPVEGALCSLPTRAYILYDDDALYIGFLCLDTAPDSISSRLQRRDNYARSDFVNITLDTFHDHRNAYMFVVTSSGVQTDGTASNEASTDIAWDGIWQSAVGRTDSGWVAEVRIPFASIRHGGSRADGWGLNLNRYIDRRQENAWWQPVNRERGFRVSEIGTLKGLDGLTSERHIEILPHAVGRWDAAAQARTYSSRNKWQNLGADMKIVPGASWTMDLAYQPDFAQVDVDEEVINLSDYPVYVEEKRPFFLESKELFDNAPISLFYTRRMNSPVAGGKTSIQKDNFRATVLAAQDENTAVGDAAAGRAVLNVGRVSSVGFTGTYTFVPRSTREFHAAAASVDARIRWRERDRLLLAVAGVDRTGLDMQPFQANADMYRDFHVINGDVSFDYRGKDYNINDLGWDSFSNSMWGRLWVGKDYYPKISLFQYLGYDLSMRRRTMADDSHLENFLDYDVYATTRENLQLQFGSEWGNWYRRNYSAAQRPYRDNFGTFATEYYPISTHWINIQSDSRKPVEIALSGAYGTILEGHNWNMEPIVTVKPRANLDLMAAVAWEHVWDLNAQTMSELGLVDASGHEIRDPRVWRMHAHYSPTLNVSLRGTVQWREDAKSVQTNLLFAWNWNSGSWFYVVYDETGRPTDPVTFSKPGDRTVRLKWTYYFAVSRI
jgi:hypothetical protein